MAQSSSTTNSTNGARPSWRVALDVLATASVIVASTLVIWNYLGRPEARTAANRAARPDPPLPPDPISLDGLSVKGDPKAHIVVIEFADFECPACGQFARDVVPVIDRDYVDTGKVRLAFWHRPLSIHSHAIEAAAFAECAALQNKFWPMHDLLFANQRSLDQPNLRRYAKGIGADAGLDACLGGSVEKRVKDFASAAAALNVTATPSFFFGTVQSDGRVKVARRWLGGRDASAVSALLDELLKQAVPGT